MVDITIPAVGVAMTEATILTWLKQPGESVAEGEAIVEIETDKATAELTSPVAGRLGRHLVAEGDAVDTGATVARVLEGDETEDEATPEPPSPSPVRDDGAPAALTTTQAPTAAASDHSRRLSPRERRMAAQAAPVTQEAGDDGASRIRRLIAAKTLEAWQTVPHFIVTRELDAEPLLAGLAAARAAARGSKPTITDLLLLALASALTATGDDGEIALAVATDRGVMNPLIGGARTADLHEMSLARAAAVSRAREGRLGEGDIGAATTTLSNLGTARVDAFTGVITPGQRTLITVGSISLRPWIQGGGLIPRHTVHVTVNADHRALDGADAAALLEALSTAVADSASMPNPKEAA